MRVLSIFGKCNHPRGDVHLGVLVSHAFGAWLARRNRRTGGMVVPSRGVERRVHRARSRRATGDGRGARRGRRSRAVPRTGRRARPPRRSPRVRAGSVHRARAEDSGDEGRAGLEGAACAARLPGSSRPSLTRPKGAGWGDAGAGRHGLAPPRTPPRTPIGPPAAAGSDPAAAESAGATATRAGVSRVPPAARPGTGRSPARRGCLAGTTAPRPRGCRRWVLRAC